ncbi:MAG TPA: lytic transglycosylase domain-containing protein [Conexibacter sp.]|jgi:hypothetical protein
MKTAIGLLAALLLLPVLMMGAAASVIGGGIGGFGSDAAGGPVANIPAAELRLYRAAASRYRIPWSVLAAIGKAECDHGRDPDPSCWRPGSENYAGAGGPMQFLAPTWATYGVDADRDGRADRWNPADAIFGAANYLRASGARTDLRQAIWAYNHSDAYVADVLDIAERYRREAAAMPPPTPQAVEGDAAALAQAVLSSDRIELRPEAVSDVRSGRIDGRLLAVLLTLSQGYTIAGVGPFLTGHSQYTTGGSVSNHSVGRAVDIGTVNGQLVNDASPAARAMALTIARLPAPIRPTEVGTPFGDISLPGFFNDSEHEDHLHVGFDG